MKIRIVAFVFLVVVGVIYAQQPAKTTMDHSSLEQSADVVIHYDPYNNNPMKISIGSSKDKESTKVVLEEKFFTTSKSLEKIFNDSPKKDLIVIIYEKNGLDDSELNNISIRLRDYFVARGFKKIFIWQAYGNGSAPEINLLEYPKMKDGEQSGGGVDDKTPN